MEILYQTFNYYLNKAENILISANTEENPAKWLFKNNFRTPLFMLEALTKVYKRVSDKDTFEKLNKLFKASEDLIGEIDFFYYYAEVLDGDDIKRDLTKKAQEKEAEYNGILKDKDWLNGKRITKIRKQLSELPKINIAEETAKIREFYTKEIDKIISFSQSGDFKFEDIEDDVHEMRRKLRWLSIYPQAFLGLFKYADRSNSTPEHIKKYLTDKIINSPYNVFPTALTFKEHIEINKDYFLALSWVIDAIGDLKDEGLKSDALEIVHHGNIDKKQMDSLLQKSKDILVPFFKEGNLEHLLA
ncbi:hypothetical protein Pedsa_0785 [Pseudopedobacter saltans DSM 12145]|uniref:Uncharacterized protein n=1 Tax=Pseudopedobacter saltans (strain ATCC 51119 / DSM 12145 / JCM 21818 / CCUG 39354 / LMG 10337 / NBRC 100064 / NCIMB 13643) TaxID=762903 RepID=F0S960_PSESL|nr:hypothetical protein [Pseudopedobacter saltans]ADY51358.1 hypothetical protein Pedsa_0785 [Pseudopedobacter saltans DSM 12145]